MKTDPNDTVHPSSFENGLTKREYMATQIMGHMAPFWRTQSDPFATAAEDAVRMADALIEELNKDGPNGN